MASNIEQPILNKNSDPLYRSTTLNPHYENYGKNDVKQIGGSHYSKQPIEPIDYIMKNKLGFNEGNVVKYVTRHKDKNGAEDILKAIHYLEFILKYEYGKER